MIENDPRVMAWVAVATGYCLAAVYIRVFSQLDYPTMVWVSYLFVGASMFITINRTHLFTPETYPYIIVEWVLMISAVMLGITTFLVARKYAKYHDLIPDGG